MAAVPHPPIIPPQPDNVPTEMRKLRRWAPWRAEWNEKKQKWTKIPHRAARPEYGLSNKNATGWVTFDEAMAAYKANCAPGALRLPDGTPFALAGVGYLMTGPHGIVGVDLDNCRDPSTGVIDDWAAKVMRDLDSYTEVSPSGTGLHIMVSGEVPEDWTNHERGIEVYGGNEARFLCVTGNQVPGTCDGVEAPPNPGLFDVLATRYRKAKTKAEVEDLHLPGLLPVDLLPGLDELDLPPHARNFLTEGPGPGDRSRQLFAAAIALSQAGLAPDEVLSILEDNPHAMEVALDHRRQDYDKALRYLWKQCQEGRARGEQLKDEGYAAFDDLEVPADQDDEENAVAAPSGTVADDFDVLDDGGELIPTKTGIAGPTRKTKFPLVSVGKFLKRKPLQWIIKGILPRAALGVIYGASGAGKTFFALDTVGALVRGVEWRGKRVTKGRGVYIVAEGVEGFRNRVQAYCEYHGVDPDSFDIVVVPAAPQLMDKAQVKELILDLQTLGRLDFIVVDTYARTMVGGNENDTADTGVMVEHCARLHRHTGAMVILIHHTGKDASNGMRGSAALRGAADVVIEVVRTREYRAALIDKMKDGDDEGEFRFKLPVVALGEDEEGEAITSCVVEHLDAPDSEEGPKADMGGLRGHPLMALKTVSEALDLAGEITYADAVEMCINRLPPPEAGKTDRRRDIAVRALEGLFAKGRLKAEGHRVVLG